MKYILLFLSIATIVGCTYKVIEIPEECTEELIIEIVEQTNSACGSENGSFELEVLNSGGGYGSEPFTFSLNNQNSQSSGSFNGLSAGSYSVFVSNGVCESTISVEIANEDGLSAEASTEDSSCGESSGTISVDFSNSSGQVEFSLDGGPAQSSPTFTGLEAGNYSVNVSDESGCNVEISAQVGNESNYTRIETIVTASCAVSGCHAGNVSPDFRVKENIIDRADRILSRTSALTMPPASSGMSLSESEIEEIQCWVESGAKG